MKRAKRELITGEVKQVTTGGILWYSLHECIYPMLFFCYNADEFMAASPIDLTCGESIPQSPVQSLNISRSVIAIMCRSVDIQALH